MTTAAYKPCSAMSGHGISDPNTQPGIDFCIKQCPYPVCIILESMPGHTKKHPAVTERSTQAKALFATGISRKEIATILKVHPRTIQRYLSGST